MSEPVIGPDDFFNTPNVNIIANDVIGKGGTFTVAPRSRSVHHKEVLPQLRQEWLQHP